MCKAQLGPPRAASSGLKRLAGVGRMAEEQMVYYQRSAGGGGGGGGAAAKQQRGSAAAKEQREVFASMDTDGER